MQISDTVARGTVKPIYPVIQYPHRAADGGDAIANGFVYRGKSGPGAERTSSCSATSPTGRIWYAERAEVLAADDGNPATVAPIHEIDAGLRRLVEQAATARAAAWARHCPAPGPISGRGRVDMRFAVDDAGELYVLTKA